MVKRTATLTGFTLIELLVVITLLGILLMEGMSYTRAWVESADVQQAKGVMQLALARTRGLALQNPSAVTSGGAATLCLHDTTLRLYSGAPASCTGDAVWSAEIPGSKTVLTMNGSSFVCLAFDHTGVLISSTLGTSSCSTSASYVITEGKESVSGSFL